jgi:pimeloyl-ACP methyl ester carboxylesterase
MGQPETRYARAGEVNIAYQVVGDGPVDLVWAYGLASNIEVFWEEPSLAAFLRRLSEFTRLILFDRRGCGLSDRHGTTATPTLEERMDDVLAVLDAVGSQQVSILGISEGGSLAALFAATHPERTARIILYGTLTHYEAHARYQAAVGDGTIAGFVDREPRLGDAQQLGGAALGPEHGGRRAVHRVAGQVRETVGEPRRHPVPAVGALRL